MGGWVRLWIVQAALAALFLVSAPVARAEGLTLTSPDIAEGATIATQQIYRGCGGQDISPALSWSGAPAGTKSFALTLYDPDAPTGSGFWHWVVYDIPPGVTGLAKGAGAPGSPLLPAGARENRTDRGIFGYSGPCPPEGDPPHHYRFTLYAVDVAKLPVPADASPAVIGFNLHFHTLAKVVLTGFYGR